MNPLSETSLLLTQGGDARIETTPPHHKNPYGCAPFPDPALLDFGSCTASVISSEGFAAADALRVRLLDHSIVDETLRIRQELAGLCGLPTSSGVEFMLVPSGTDALRLAVQSIYSADSEPLIVMAEPAESGSGVPAALATGHRGHVIAVSVREQDGEPRPAAAIDAEVTSLTLSALAAERPVLLILTDVSKSGLIAPSVACVAQLHHHAPERITVLVDACQFRLSQTTLRNYLARDFAVAVTGSKFVGGPSFSGALILPPALSERPAVADDIQRPPEVCPPGLLLRWEAALQSLRQFRTLPEKRIRGFLERFAAAISSHIAQHPQLEALPVTPLVREPIVVGDAWDTVQTIFPFLLYRPGSEGYTVLNREETLRVFGLLPDAQSSPHRGRLGQPVLCGRRQSTPVSALRLCVSARTVIAALQGGDLGEARVIHEACDLLDQAALHAAASLSD
jgi:hypothetical protein